MSESVSMESLAKNMSGGAKKVSQEDRKAQGPVEEKMRKDINEALFVPFEAAIKSVQPGTGIISQGSGNVNFTV